MIEMNDRTILISRLGKLMRLAEAYQEKLMDLNDQKISIADSPEAEKLSMDLAHQIKITEEADSDMWGHMDGTKI